MKTTLEAYITDKRGQFAVIMSIAAFPLLVATSYVIDVTATESVRSNVKQSLDAAVLAAVSNNSIDEAGKKDVAKQVFNNHYVGRATLDLEVDVSDGQVMMSATGMNEATIARSVGVDGFKINETSIAEMNRENTICVLALADKGNGKLRFLDSTEFNSPTCSVQSNSKDTQGVLSKSTFQPVAKSFCSAGGATGAFSPSIRGQCREIADPYVSRIAPQPGKCIPARVFGLKVDSEGKVIIKDPNSSHILNWHEPPIVVVDSGGGKHEHDHCHLPEADGFQNCHFGRHNVGDIHGLSPDSRLEDIGLSQTDIDRLVGDYGEDKLLVPESYNYTKENGTYGPGTYCGGLTVDGQNVTFLAGTYIIKDGPLTFKNGATAVAKDVSFIMHGENAIVTVESGSFVDLKAPQTGPMAGLAFYQDKNAMTGGLKKDRTPPTNVNIISSGGELNVTGTMYFPTEALDILGDSVLGAKAPATSFIAYQVTFAGATKAEVKVDHIAGSIPAMLPRSDDGARLVQ